MVGIDVELFEAVVRADVGIVETIGLDNPLLKACGSK